MPSIRRCVFGCLTTGVTLHRFPHPKKFPERFRLWVDLAGDYLSNFSDHNIYKYKKVCDIHFLGNVRNRNNRLSALAIPTNHLPGKNIEKLKNFEESIGNTLTSDVVEAYAEQCSDNCKDETSTGPFSWNKSSKTIAQTAEYVKEGYKTFDGTEDVLIYNNLAQHEHTKDNDTARVPHEQVHEDFQCNTCKNIISGYRYTCVQCPDYDICSSCEAGGSHASHYMLRVPEPRPYGEVQSVLESIRRHLLNTSILLNPTLSMSDSIKLELKDEVEQVLDPLQNVPESTRESLLEADFNESTVIPQQEQESVSDEPTELSLIDTRNKSNSQEQDSADDEPTTLPIIETRTRKRKLTNQNEICEQDVNKNTRVIPKLHTQKRPKVVLNDMLLMAESVQMSTDIVINENMESCENIRGNLEIEDENIEIFTKTLINEVGDTIVEIVSETSRNEVGDTIVITPPDYLSNASKSEKMFNSDGGRTSSRPTLIEVDDIENQQLQGISKEVILYLNDG